METFIEILLAHGGTVVMAVLFIWLFLEDRKDLKDEKENSTAVLKELSTSNKNIADSLMLLKTSMDNTNENFKRHDERSIAEFEEIKTDVKIIKERGK